MQMLRGVTDRHPASFGKRVDTPFSLGDKLQKLQSVRMAEGFGHSRELFKQRHFGVIT